MDSLGNKLNETIENYTDSIPAQMKRSLQGKLKQAPNSLKQRAAGYLPNSPLKGAKDLIREGKEALTLKKILNNHKVSVVNEGQMERTYWGSGYHFLNTLEINGSVTVAKIPLSVMFMHQDYLNPSFTYRNVFRTNFDKETFLNNYRKKLKDKLDVDKLVPKDRSLQAAKKAAEKAVRNELDGMLQEYASEFREPLAAFDTIKDLSTNNIGNVFQSLVSQQYVSKMKEKEQQLQQLSTEAQSGKITERSQAIPGLKKEIAIYTKLLAFYQRYQAMKKKLDLVGLENRLNEEGLARMQQFDNMLDDPGSLQQLAGQYLQQSGLERFFMHVEQMNAGQHSVSLSPLSLYNYLNSGLSMEISKDNKYFFFLAGKEKDLNSLYDRSNFNALNQNDHVGMGVRMGRGSIKENHTHLSVFTFRQSKVTGAAQNFDMPRKNTLVLGLSNRFTIGETSTVEMELSKSSTVFTQAEYGNDTAGRRKSAISQMLNTEDFGSSLAMVLNYAGHFQEAGLNVGANYTHVSSAYTNPGSAFMMGGSKDAGLHVKKTFLKNKIQLQARGNLREYAYAMLPGRKWQNLSSLFETRFRFSNGQQASLKYQPIRSIRKIPGAKITTNSTNRLTAELSFQQRIRQTYYRNVVSTAYNASRYLLTDSLANLKSVTLSSLQNITIGRQLVYWNVTYTYAHNPGGPAYLNSVFNTDAGITYMLGGKVSATTGLNYSSAQNWYRQVGGRQTISANINSRMQVSLFVDYRQNIQQYDAYYDDLVRADWSFRYNF